MITLMSDFEKQSQGVAQMEAAIYEINPDARVLHLMHGLPDYDIMTGAWALESVAMLQPGTHVCVVDPGVGGTRAGLIIATKRGDYLIGPDNGVLVPAARILGVKEAVSIENRRLMRKTVSPVFHGRDVFAVAAAHISKREQIFDFGPVIEDLVKAPYEEAKVDGKMIRAQVIHINKFGSVHLNIMQNEFDKLKIKHGTVIVAELGSKKALFTYARTFSDVKKGQPLVFKDDYMRMELALNMGNLAQKAGLKVGMQAVLKIRQ